MYTPSYEVKQIRQEIRQALQSTMEAYDKEDKNMTMPNFHFNLGQVVGLTERLMSANSRNEKP